MYEYMKGIAKTLDNVSKILFRNWFFFFKPPTKKEKKREN